MKSYTLALALLLFSAQPALGQAGPRIVHQPSMTVPLSAAVQVGDIFWLSGGIGVTPETLAMTTGRTAAETRNIMEQFGMLLTDLGLGFEDVVKATVYLTDIEDYEQMNEVYGSYFRVDPPARETVVVSELVRGAAIEISFVAARSN